MSESPLRVAVVNDYQVVVDGLARMLLPYVDRVAVVEEDVGEPVSQPVDIALYDTFGQPQSDALDVAQVRNQGMADRLVVYTWNLDPALVSEAFSRGVDGYLAKQLGAEELVGGLERIGAGERLVLPEPSSEPPQDDEEIHGDWPGRKEGLSPRESEVLALITQGLTNQEIADRAYLSINTVKAYIRTAYRKAGVSSRTRAVLWGIEHGFEPGPGS